MSNKDLIEIANTDLYINIKNTLNNARRNVSRAVNFAIVDAYWNIGRMIVEEEQNGADRAGYGDYLIKSLSKKLTNEFGKGLSVTNLKYMRRFYNAFQKSQTLSDQLSWSHYLILSKIDGINKRKFYFNESISSNWSVRELERQVASLLFERVTLSIEKDEVLKFAKEGHKISKPQDLVKDPYILEFLGLKQNVALYEKDLESALINHLKEFLLELGKGFCFVSRQQRITLDGDHYFIDLVFYNRITKCFVLIDLKIGKLSHKDIGQMQMYTNFYKRTKMLEGDNEPIGILLCSEKNEAIVKYTLPEDNNQIFASKYKLYLPTEEELKAELIRERDLVEVKKHLNE
jgi:predicted nuclease of restriction endonuclease-like (RecB) superfamily